MSTIAHDHMTLQQDFSAHSTDTDRQASDVMMLFTNAVFYQRLPNLHCQFKQEPGRMRLLWILPHDHPESCCRGKALWSIETTPEEHLTLLHRNRRPPLRGWHLHAIAPCTRYGLLWLIRNISGHDAVLYAKTQAGDARGE